MIASPRGNPGPVAYGEGVTRRFNPPPNWPVPPRRFNPPPDWEPPADFPPPPAGWKVWLEEGETQEPIVDPTGDEAPEMDPAQAERAAAAYEAQQQERRRQQNRSSWTLLVIGGLIALFVIGQGIWLLLE